MSTSILVRFYIYQKLRFPIIILSLGLLPALLSTAAIVAKSPSTFQVIGGLIASLLYLLHVRIIDERRDFHHDNIYHKSRPLQTGLISMKELQMIDLFAVAIFLGIAGFAGIYPFLLGLLMLSYSFIAGKEFFMGEKLRQHFFIYNSINTLQSFLMQLFAYSFFAGYIPFTALVAFHYIFTCIGSVIFEFVRKIKIPGMDGTGKDTYTWYLGFNNAIIIYIIFSLLATFFFYQITTMITGQNVLWIFLSTILFGTTLLTALIHIIKKTVHTEQLMQLSFVVVYAIFNLLIYYKSIKL